MRIFIDVGAHTGQTLDEVIKPEYAFDEVHAFEPMPAEFEMLLRRYTGVPRVLPYNEGLLDRNCIRYVYGANSFMEASIFAGKRDLVNPEQATPCAFRRATNFLRTLPYPATIIMKLNCEGSETIILDDLIETETIWLLHHVLIDFDVRKIPGEEYRERAVLRRLQSIGFDRYSIADKVMVGDTHGERTRAWLAPVLPER